MPKAVYNYKSDLLAKANREKYLKAPTIEEIEAFMAKLGVTAPQFEMFYGIKPDTIRQIRVGERNLPCKWWHFIFEEIVPKYGAVSNFEKPKRTIYNNVTLKSQAPKKPKKAKKQDPPGAALLDKLKEIKGVQST